MRFTMASLPQKRMNLRVAKRSLCLAPTGILPCDESRRETDPEHRSRGGQLRKPAESTSAHSIWRQVPVRLPPLRVPSSSCGNNTHARACNATTSDERCQLQLSRCLELPER